MPTGIEEAFALLVQDTLRRTERVTEGLRELEGDYGGAPEDRSYRTFVDALQLAAQGARVVLESHYAHFHREGAHQEAWYEAVQRIAEDLGSRLEEQLRLLRIRRADELEVFAAPMTRLAKKMVPNCELLFFPWAQDRYELEVYDQAFAAGLNPRLGRDLARAYGADIKFLKLRHSSLRQLDVFHHTVFAHEVAHEFLERTPEPSQGAKHTVLNQVIAQQPLPRALGRHRAELENWLAELACDIVAMRVIGPAYLVAFAEVTVANRALTPDAEGGSHPPAEIRYRVLLTEGERFLADPRTSWALPALRQAARAHPRFDDRQTLDRAEDWLDAALGALRDALPDWIPEALYDPETLRRDLPLVRDLADLGVPPCERLVALECSAERAAGSEWSEPLDWRSIINGVLFWQLDDATTDDSTDWRARAQTRDRAARLALGGIELSEFHRRAAQLRRELGALRLPDDWAGE